MSISNAHIEFNENGTPIATEFGDIYFSDAKGLEETEYVFLQHNQLPQRWQHHSESRFTIAETGFGTGLNFLVTLLHFDLLIQQQPTLDLNLHFISIEKFPIALDDLKKALSAYPQLNVYIEPLLANTLFPFKGVTVCIFCNTESPLTCG